MQTGRKLGGVLCKQGEQLAGVSWVLGGGLGYADGADRKKIRRRFVEFVGFLRRV